MPIFRKTKSSETSQKSMPTTFIPAATDNTSTGYDKRGSRLRGKKPLFKKTKPSEEWHQQIDFTAGVLRPSDKRFPFLLVQKHTDQYLKKKGRLTQSDIDLRLSALIQNHEARDVALAACAYAMSPASVRALLNVELSVAPVTFYGFELFLHSLIAVNYSNVNAVSDLETQWARRMLGYAIHGAESAGRYLEGLCSVLATSHVPNLNMVPDFEILARRAFGDFALYLEGLRLKCLWVTAHASIAWLSKLAKTSPATTPSGHLLPEHLLDRHFPIWRIWATWRPDLYRTSLLNGLDCAKRGALAEMFALEGPDFITGTQRTLREGMIAQYGTKKSLVQFQSLVVKVPTHTKEELGNMLNRLAVAMENALAGGQDGFKLFVQLTMTRPITVETLQLLEAIRTINDAPDFHVHDALLEIYLARPKIHGLHITALQHLIYILDDANSDALRKVLLQPWLAQGIEKCVLDCQAAVRTHMETGLAWTHLLQEFHIFLHIIKSSEHCLPILGAGLKAQLEGLPSHKTLATLVNIHDFNGGVKVDGKRKDPLNDAIEECCMRRYFNRGSMSTGSIDHRSQHTVEAIFDVWNSTTSTQLRRLAVIACSITGVDFVQRCGMLVHITEMPQELATEIIKIMDADDVDKEKSCIAFTRLLVRKNDMIAVQTWKGVLYSMMEKHSDTLLDYTLRNLRVSEWCQWMLGLFSLFSDTIMDPKAAPPKILNPNVHLWAREISDYITPLVRLEEFLGDDRAPMLYILNGRNDHSKKELLGILDALQAAPDLDIGMEKLMQGIISKLSLDGADNLFRVDNCLKSLLKMSDQGVEAYQRVLDWVGPKQKRGNVPLTVIQVRISGWLQDADMSIIDKAAIRAIARLFGLETYEYHVSLDVLKEVAAYYEDEERQMLAEADRLEGIKKTLKAEDPLGTAIFLKELGIQDTSPLDEEIERLPLSVRSAVEKCGDNHVEVSFPLTLADLQRGAMGVGDAKTVLIHLFLDPAYTMPPSFCVHLDTDMDPELNKSCLEHTPWNISEKAKEPERVYCRGRLTPLVFQLNRNLHRYFRVRGYGIADLHAFVKSNLKDLPYECMVCGARHATSGEQLRRPLPCDKAACMEIWENTPLTVKIPELWSDPFTVDMLLTGVYAAAASNRTDLLPGCPIPLPVLITVTLNLLPSLATMKTSNDLSRTLRNVSRDAEKLLVWTCTHYRGYIASATGLCRIPGLSVGTHQFVLANTNPQLETAFAARLPKNCVKGSTTCVLFHGTTLDRLPCILSQGLIVGSGTHLQRTGAVYGKGIYLAEEPSTSLTYAPTALSWRMSGLNNMKLLLGCEVVRNGNRVANGVHVIKDQRDVMVRYIMLFDRTAPDPMANHIVGPLRSAMHALRSGAV
ncbi:hypothetical protein K504DRAFT_465862 [Pleomassaria siparia CBS 279.74]|uniref:PARP catalytic domain-containing protein n=1 Tax=Pleomassaria siparia CBS 279.74 TaxID=1314801 RepID=A0A6G1KE36_9PLEO|nr:hypothetical protein K504DRAFT_465862 [Pleomassaria siparia CBS 279.74]